MLEIEGIGSEVGTLEVVTVFLVTAVSLTVFLIFVGAWKLTGRRPLFYDLFLVEIHSLDTRRLVQVLQLGQEFRPRSSWSDVMTRMRSRVHSNGIGTPEASTDRHVSDTNVFIQSPATVMDDSTSSVPSPSSSTLWEIEMPSTGSSVNNASHESQFAAAAAIAVLGRGGFQARAPGRIDVVPNATNESPSTASVDLLSVEDTVNSTDVYESNGSQDSNIIVPMNINLVTNELETVQGNSTDTTTVDNAPVTHENELIATDSGEANCQDSCTEDTSLIDSSAVEGDSIIRLKFLDDTQRDARATMTDTIAKFKSVHFGDAVAAGRVIRLIYQGQLLREDSRTLASYGLRDGCVVHCHVSNTPYSTQGQSSSQASAASSGLRRDVPRTSHSSSPTVNNRHESHYPRWAVGLLLYTYRFPLIGAPLDAIARFLFDRQSEIQYLFYLRLFNSVLGNTEDVNISPLDRAADAAAMPSPQRLCLGDYLLWIFAGQFVAIWGFVYTFPQLCDNTALGLLVLLTLYFFFVVCRSRDHIIELRPSDENAPSTNTSR
ncbi:ubiquitin family protein [Dictyocaulus viviparus]|uniref:Ubiquitin family protein n=1 Tax=Dictyocaulus viviparus TaxID=29172 RepID=A0A0D8XFY9_DICVI|nr:ubiquitin family protein [Dictyocaulus viviparus]